MKNVNKTTLKNGLRIITIPIKSTKAATILVLVRVGSKNEEKRISGISHFIEHMLFKGTKKRNTPLKVVEELDKIGGLQNAFTSEEYTGYYGKVKSSYLHTAIDWVADIYLNSLDKEEEIKKEKGVIIEELNMIQDNPMIYCQYLFQNLLYKDQPAGWDVGGSKKSVSNITRDDILDYKAKHYIAQNTVMVVAGNIGKAKTEKMIKEAFSKIASRVPEKRPKVIENQKNPEALVFYKETDQTHFCLGVRSYNIFHPYRYTQNIIASLLGGMMSSRLFVKIRDELGLAYYISTGIDSNPDTGYLMTQAGVDNRKVKLAIEAIIKEYKDLKKNKVPAKELKRVKEHLKGKGAIYLEGSDALAKFYGTTELLENRTYDIESIFREIDKVTADDIRKVANEMFKSKNLNLSLIGPFKNKKPFLKILSL